MSEIHTQECITKICKLVSVYVDAAIDRAHVKYAHRILTLKIVEMAIRLNFELCRHSSDSLWFTIFKTLILHINDLELVTKSYKYWTERFDMWYFIGIVPAKARGSVLSLLEWVARAWIFAHKNTENKYMILLSNGVSEFALTINDVTNVKQSLVSEVYFVVGLIVFAPVIDRAD